MSALDIYEFALFFRAVVGTGYLSARRSDDKGLETEIVLAFSRGETLRETMRGRLLEEEGNVKLGGLTAMDGELMELERIIILRCGTSWHSGLIGEYMLEDIARIPTDVEYASEFRYRRPVVEPNTLCLSISQGGETADTLWAMREARNQGATTLGIVNSVGSTIARETDAGSCQIPPSAVRAAPVRAARNNPCLRWCTHESFTSASRGVDDETRTSKGPGGRNGGAAADHPLRAAAPSPGACRAA